MIILKGQQKEVAALVIESLSNKEIGHRLGLTEGTIKRYLQDIYTKLGLAINSGNPRVKLAVMIVRGEIGLG